MVEEEPADSCVCVGAPLCRTTVVALARRVGRRGDRLAHRGTGERVEIRVDDNTVAYLRQKQTVLVRRFLAIERVAPGLVVPDAHVEPAEVAFGSAVDQVVFDRRVHLFMAFSQSATDRARGARGDLTLGPGLGGRREQFTRAAGIE